MFGANRRVARRTARRTTRRMNRREALFQEPEYDEEPQGYAQAPTAPAADVTGELRKLADLHGQGALTDEEFAAAKAKLLTT